MTRPEDISALAPVWRRIAALSPRAGMFTSPEWHAGWLRHVAPDARPQIAVVTGEGDRVVAIAPLCDRPFRDHGFSVPAVRFTGREVISGDYLDLLAEPDAYDDALELVLDHLVKEARRGRMLVLGEVVEGSPFDRALHARLEREGIAFRVQEARRCPYIELPGEYDDYLATLSSNLRANIRKYTRRLTQKEGLELVRLQDPAEIAGKLPDLYRLHEARWRARGEGGNFGRAGFREFLEEFVGNPPVDVRPNLYVLEKEGAAHAVLLVFHCDGVAMSYSAGWDPESPCVRFSPLTVLLGRSIETAIGEGITVYDMLRGDDVYKLNFTPTFRTTRTYLTRPRSLRARAYFAALDLGSMVRRLRRSGP